MPILRSYQVLSLLENYQDLEHEWAQTKSFIKEKCKDDLLYENYIDIDLENFLSFHVMISENKIVCFGGVEYRPGRWGVDIFRVLSKFWIHPDYRSPNLTKWSDEAVALSPKILERQVEDIKKEYRDFTLMITRQGNYLKSFQRIVRLANTVNDCDFSIIDGKHNICGHLSNQEECKQFIALSSYGRKDATTVLAEAQKRGKLLSV